MGIDPISLAAISAGVGGLVSGAGQLIGGQTAAGYAKKGIAAERALLQQATGYLQPYMGAGKTATTGLMSALGLTPGPLSGGPGGQGWGGFGAPSLISPFTFSDLSKTPGFNAALYAGLQATQGGYAAGGLGSSGAAMKGAANYAAGLAEQTYNQQLQNYLSQNAQAYSMLFGPTQLGAGAAGTAAGTTAGIAQSVGGLYGGAGGALGTGISGAAAAGAGGLTSAGFLSALPQFAAASRSLYGGGYGGPFGTPGGLSYSAPLAGVLSPFAGAGVTPGGGGYGGPVMPQGYPQNELGFMGYGF